MTETTGGAAVEGLRSELVDGILRLTINRPKRMNALDLVTMGALGEAVIAAGADERVRTIVLTGEGTAFCTGADLAAAGANPADPNVVMDTANSLIRAIVDSPVPVIAAVNGPAAGVGVSIAVAADLTYAAESAYFLLAFVNIGLMPDGGSSMLIPAAIGRARAAEMALLGERLSAADADRFGLVARTLPDGGLAAHVDAVAARTASGPRRLWRSPSKRSTIRPCPFSTMRWRSRKQARSSYSHPRISRKVRWPCCKSVAPTSRRDRMHM